METKRFVLLDVDYVTRYGRPVVRLFGKILEEDKPIIALDHDFQPYLYLLPQDLETCRRELAPFEVQKIEKLRLKDNDGKLKDFFKLTLTHPREMLPLKKELEHWIFQ